jgi:RNA polymerase sigma-70 factor (ECF subfamily)
VRKIVLLRLGRTLRTVFPPEDVVQQALLRVLRRLSSYQERVDGRFRNWVARLVESEIIDLSRGAGAKKRGGRRERPHLSGGEYVSLSSVIDPRQRTPGSALRAKEREAEIEAALRKLPEHYSEVIILRVLSSMSYAEVAQELGISEAAARTAFWRAVKRLKELLGKSSS